MMIPVEYKQVVKAAIREAKQTGEMRYVLRTCDNTYEVGGESDVNAWIEGLTQTPEPIIAVESDGFVEMFN